ncbi:MAG: TonB-dependent receptor [Microscillaceae bacterium]|jgi:hypothetical protein|nr:TonB-dependent receptor [Microscillaceae bacterium]
MKNLLLTFLGIILAGQLFAQTQTIRGQIIDQQAKSPLAGATVFIPDTEPLIGATTDAEGYYELKNVPLGRVAIKISYLGYKEQFLPNILVNAGKEVLLNVELEEQILAGAEVVIRANADKTQLNNEFSAVSSRGFSLEDVTRYAGSRNDPARMATNFAGVSGANDARNDIVIRGNSPTGLLWRLEGIDIPSPNHYGTLGTTGGPVGMLNNNVLANSDFMTGAFPAEYGNANAGVFDIKMRTGNNAKQERLFQIGFAGFEAGLEGPFNKNSKATYLVNYRYSTLAVFSALGIPFGTGTAVPQYQDISFKINLPSQKIGTFSIFGLGGTSKIDLLGSDTEKPDPQDAFGDINEDSRFKAGMGVVGVSHTYFFNKNTYSEITLAVSGSYNRGTIDSLTRSSEGQVIDRTYAAALNFSQHKYSLRAQINKKFNARNSVNIGILTDFLNVNLADSSLNRDTGNFLLLRDFAGSSTLFQAYAQWQHRFNDKLILNSGLHYQIFALNNSQAIEPRVGLKYRFNDKQSLSLGLGLHSQLQPLQTYFQEVSLNNGAKFRSNENLGFTRSMHYVLAYDNALSNDFRLKAEVYYQNIWNAAVEQTASSFSMLNAGAGFGIPDKNYLVNDGTGYNYGLELTLEKFFSQNYYFLFTTSVFNSKYEGSDKIERNTAFNGNYVVNLLGGREFKVRGKNVIFLDTKFTIAGGNRYTPIDLNASIANGYEILSEADAFLEQFPTYIRWDIKMGYRINRAKLTHEFFVDIQNISNQKNVFIRRFNRTTQSITDTNQLGLFPVVQYRLTF